jgi:hypothetical protein
VINSGDAGQGRRAANAFHANATAELDELLDPLGPDDREHFRRTMTTIITEWSTNAAPAKPM